MAGSLRGAWAVSERQDRKPDLILQCAACGVLFRASTMDKTQHCVVASTGRVYCTIDAFSMWLEARARMERWIEMMGGDS